MPRKAFTLLEVLLTMAVIAVVLAVTYPSLDAMYGGFKIQAATDTVRAAWAEARSHAINEGRAYRFSISPGTGKFRLAPDAASSWSGGNAPAGADDPANPALVLEDTVPDGVRLSLPNNAPAQPESEGGTTAMSPAGGGDASGWTTCVVFMPDGTCHDDAEVVFEVSGARSLSVKIRGLTASVTVRPL